MTANLQRKIGFYEKYVKRVLDIICAAAAIIVFCWLYAIIALAIRIKLGGPVLFKQPRPGKIDKKTGQERIFYMYKFRTMTEEKDRDGNLLPDEERMTKLGAFLRKTSLDELPEAFNILCGDMSVVGPRPQLVRDMTFMSERHRMRHTARPGLSGLAQINGRNAITWDEKLEWDLRYIEKVSFGGDLKIVLQTIKKAFFDRDGIGNDESGVSEDYGDYLLRLGRISEQEYEEKQKDAVAILSV